MPLSLRAVGGGAALHGSANVKGSIASPAVRSKSPRRGDPPGTRIFNRLTEAKAWMRDIELKVSRGEHISTTKECKRIFGGPVKAAKRALRSMVVDKPIVVDWD